MPQSTWDLSFLTRDRTRIPCTGRWIPNLWTTREVPRRGLLCSQSHTALCLSLSGASNPPMFRPILLASFHPPLPPRPPGQRREQPSCHPPSMPSNRNIQRPGTHPRSLGKQEGPPPACLRSPWWSHSVEVTGQACQSASSSHWNISPINISVASGR